MAPIETTAINENHSTIACVRSQVRSEAVSNSWLQHAMGATLCCVASSSNWECRQRVVTTITCIIAVRELACTYRRSNASRPPTNTQRTTPLHTLAPPYPLRAGATHVYTASPDMNKQLCRIANTAKTGHYL
jgi:hypothetical protein